MSVLTCRADLVRVLEPSGNLGIPQEISLGTGVNAWITQDLPGLHWQYSADHDQLDVALRPCSYVLRHVRYAGTSIELSLFGTLSVQWTYEEKSEYLLWKATVIVPARSIMSVGLPVLLVPGHLEMAVSVNGRLVTLDVDQEHDSGIWLAQDSSALGGLLLRLRGSRLRQEIEWRVTWIAPPSLT